MGGEAEGEMLEVDDEIITCWCGAKGTADELFDDSVYDEGCGGSGVLHCHCGGDLCVCHNHFEVECPGCKDCDDDDLDYDPRDYDDLDYDDGDR